MITTVDVSSEGETIHESVQGGRRVPSAQINGTAETRLYYESAEQGFRIVVTTIPPGHSTE